MYSIIFQTKKTVELWRFVTIKACHYGLKNEFFYFWIWGVGNLNPVLWQPDTSQRHKIRLRINPKTLLWHSEVKRLIKGVMQIFWVKKKWQIFLIFVIFHIRKVPRLLKPLLWTSASPYFNSVSFRHTFIIHFSHYDQQKLIFWWFRTATKKNTSLISNRTFKMC